MEVIHGFWILIMIVGLISAITKAVKDKKSDKPNLGKYLEPSDYIVYSRYAEQANVEWANIDSLPEIIGACYRDNPFLMDDLRSLKICPRCFELWGQVRLGNGEAVKQTCLCKKRNENRWHSYDFNTKYETCNCCGLEVIPSGSRWSVLYCKDCKDRIRELNYNVGKCVIPIGRHSLMNNVYLTGDMPISSIGEFMGELITMNRRIGSLTDHHRSVLAKRTELLGISKNTPILDLMLKTNALELQQLKNEAFFELLSACTNLSVDEVKSLHDELMS